MGVGSAALEGTPEGKSSEHPLEKQWALWFDIPQEKGKREVDANKWKEALQKACSISVCSDASEVLCIVGFRSDFVGGTGRDCRDC